MAHKSDATSASINTGKTVRKIALWIGVVAIAIGISYYLLSERPCKENDTRERCKNRYSAGTIYQEVIPPPSQGGYIEDGIYVAPQKTKAVDGKVPNVVTTTKTSYGETIDIQYNCDRDLEIATLAPGEELEIVHDTTRLLEKDLRCSYSMTGDSFPIYGIKNGVTLSRFKYQMPFPPTIPPHAVVVSMIRQRGSIKEHVADEYFPKEGEKLLLINPSKDKIKVVIGYNYPPELRGPDSQIGRGEYAVHLKATKYRPELLEE